MSPERIKYKGDMDWEGGGDGSKAAYDSSHKYIMDKLKGHVK